MNKKQVDDFEVLQTQLKGFYDEMQTLVKKSPNDGVNKFKLALINSVLTNANSFFGKSKRPLIGFTVFDEDEIVTNSDVLIVLSQYLNYLEKIRSDNVKVERGGLWYWLIDGEVSEIRTAPPKKLEN